MLSPTVLATRYATFAAIATGVNIATQYVSSSVYTGSFELFVAMILGTATGLVTKYLLDKRYIFLDRTNLLRDHSVKFILYSATGVITTLIFWGTELAFEAVSDDRNMRYVGAILGLAIGYVTKYHLDRRFVFREEPS